MVHAKVSSRGLWFFAHDRRQPGCPSAGEAPDHLWLKSELATAIRRAGCTAALEAVPGPGDNGGWRADVLAVGPGGRRFAFEVQLSALTSADGEARMRRYAADDITTVWFTLRNAPWLWKLPGCKVEAIEPVGPGIDAALIATRGCALMAEDGYRRWLPKPDVILTRLVERLLDGRVVAYPVNITEVIRSAERTREFGHHDAIALVPAQHAAAAREQAAREAAAAARHAAERERHERNTDAWYQRQRRLLPGVAQAACAVENQGGVWAGIPATRVEPRGTRWIQDAVGNEKTAQGVPVFVGPRAGSLRLFAVVCPLGGWITQGHSASWRRRGVRVYVDDAREAERVGAALGWRRDDPLLIVATQ